MTITPLVTNGQFRKDFPEFNDASKYTDSTLMLWLTVATAMVNADIWDPNIINIGVELFAAHNIVLEAEDIATVTVGGIPGVVKGPVSSKSVDKASASYDTAASLEEDAGHWNLTKYGKRFINIARMQGAAPLVSVPCSPGGGFGVGVSGAWAGPFGQFVGCDPNDP